ncbi:MAG: STN domain-containing protein, partial [bacterium]
MTVQDAPLRQVLQEVTRQTGIDIVFSDDLVSGLGVSCNFENLPLHDALESILQNTGLSFRLLNENQIVLVGPES